MGRASEVDINVEVIVDTEEDFQDTKNVNELKKEDYSGSKEEHFGNKDNRGYIVDKEKRA